MKCLILRDYLKQIKWLVLTEKRGRGRGRGGVTIFTKLRRKLTKRKDVRIGQAYISEILPRFTDRANSTNKTMWIVKNMLEGDIAEVFEIGESGRTRKVDLTDKAILTQNGQPVNFNKKGKLVNGDPKFEVNHYQTGKLCSFKSLGYLGDTEKVQTVVGVFDQFVFFGESKSGDPSIRSHRELEVLKPRII